MIQNYKEEETVECTSEQKAYLRLPPKIWELIPSDIRNANSLGMVKEEIKFWTAGKCTCKLCKTYIGNVGLI